MANKKNLLKDLKVTKVDFVDAGANPEANIVLFKRDPSAEAAGTAPEKPGFLHSVISAIAKSLGATDAQIDAAVEEVAKSGDAQTFGEKMVERQLRRTTDEIWDFCYALQESLCSILRDPDVSSDDKNALMAQSYAEFSSAIANAIPKWSSGVPTKVEKSAGAEMTEERLQIAKEARERLDAMIQKAAPAADTTPAGAQQPTAEEPINKSEPVKGENDMKIDKSKLSAEELAALEAIEKKAGIQEEVTQPVEKAATTAATTPAEDGEDIYKGLNPVIAAELKDLRKRADEAEDREMFTIAKKYELLGKKPEELAPVLKSLKASGGTAYADMIGVLDASLAVVEKSPAFTEIGKRGGTGAPVDDATSAWAQIEKKADEIQKSAPTLSRAEAVDKACAQNPDLVHQYEENR